MMKLLYDEINKIYDRQMAAECWQEELARLLDLGECCGMEWAGSSFNEFKDAVPCPRDAIVALIYGEWAGLVLCAKCYRKLVEANL